MKISDSTKKLLLALAIVLVILLPVFLVIMPLNDKIDATKAEITSLQERYDFLSDLFDKIPQFREGTKKCREGIAEIVYKFPADIQQENTIMFLADTERLFPISLYQIAFAATDSAEIGTMTTDLSETVQSEEPLGADYTGVHTTDTIGYRVPYEDFKTFINYIEQWEDRMTFSNLTAVYSLDENEVTGSFMINQYAIRNDGFVLDQPEIDIENGTHNIFVADSEQWEEWMDENGDEEGTVESDDKDKKPEKEDKKPEKEDKKPEKEDKKPEKDDKKPEKEDKKPEKEEKDPVAKDGDYDVYLMMNQPQSDAESFIVGISDDKDGKGTLKSDDNLSRLTRFTFTQENGKYYVNYKLSYKYRNREIKPGKDIVLNIYSCSRAGSEDEVQSGVAVINDTDKKVIVNILNDDDKSPRVSIREKKGKVTIAK